MIQQYWQRFNENKKRLNHKNLILSSEVVPNVATSNKIMGYFEWMYNKLAATNSGS